MQANGVSMAEPTPERIEIAHRIRTLRRARGISLQRLAETAAISPGYLSEVERAQSAISGEKLAALAENLGVTADYLLSGRDNTRTNTTVTIPSALSEAATTLNLSYAETLRLLAGKESLVARRSTNVEPEWTKEDWKEFYLKVKPYL